VRKDRERQHGGRGEWSEFIRPCIGQEGKGQRTEEWIGRGKMNGGERNGKGERRVKG